MSEMEERILEEIHKTREVMYAEERNDSYAMLADKHNERAKDILKKWNIELPEATYLTQLVSR